MVHVDESWLMLSNDGRLMNQCLSHIRNYSLLITMNGLFDILADQLKVIMASIMVTSTQYDCTTLGFNEDLIRQRCCAAIERQ